MKQAPSSGVLSKPLFRPIAGFFSVANEGKLGQSRLAPPMNASMNTAASIQYRVGYQRHRAGGATGSVGEAPQNGKGLCLQRSRSDEGLSSPGTARKEVWTTAVGLMATTNPSPNPSPSPSPSPSPHPYPHPNPNQGRTGGAGGPDCSPLVVCGLNTYENRMTVMHFTV